jgi:hypothetical protein
MASAELIGGPEDGRQVCMLGPDEAPMDRFVLPARIAVDEGPFDSELPPLLRYDRAASAVPMDVGATTSPAPRHCRPHRKSREIPETRMSKCRN